MSIFYPTVMVNRVSDIRPETLDELGVSALILDVDNTLASHNHPIPDADILLWLERMREAGIRLVIASNNRPRRVRPFAEGLGLAYSANSMKPLPVGFIRVSGRLGLPPRSFGVVGDQIFTDVLGGNLFGAKTFLVNPIKSEAGPFFRLKRKVELMIIKRYRIRQAGKEDFHD